MNDAYDAYVARLLVREMLRQHEQRLLVDRIFMHPTERSTTMYDDTSRAARLTRRMEKAAEEFWTEETGYEARRLPMTSTPGRVRSFAHSPFVETEIYLVTVQHIETRVMHSTATTPVVAPDEGHHRAGAREPAREQRADLD